MSVQCSSWYYLDLLPSGHHFHFEVLTAMHDEQVSSLLHEVGLLRISALQPTVARVLVRYFTTRVRVFVHTHRTSIVHLSICSDEGEHVDYSN